MAENNNLEKIAKSAFDQFQSNPPAKAWHKLSSELDRHQEIVQKHKNDRTRLIFITVIIFIISILSWQFLNQPVYVATTGKAMESSSSNDKQRVFKQSKFKNISKIQGNDIANKIPGNVIPAIKTDHQQSNLEVAPNLREPVSRVPSTATPSALSIIQTTKLNSKSISGAPNEFYSTAGLDNNTFTSISVIEIMKAQINPTEMVPSTLTYCCADSMTKFLNHAYSPLSVAAYFSPSYSWQILKDNTDNNIDDESMYNDRENAMFSFTAGVNVLYKLEKNWSIVSGAYYTRNARSISAPAVYAQMNSANEMYFEYSTSNGIIEVPLDDSHNSLHAGDTIITQSKSYQYINSVGVPLLIRFSSKKSKNTFYIEAGLSTNFLMQSKAVIRIDDYKHTVINNNHGLKTTSFGYIASFGIEHHFSHKLDLLIGPVLRGTFTSVTKNSAVDTYPYSIGINIGMVKHF